MRAALAPCLLAVAALAACDGSGPDHECAPGLPALSAETFRAGGDVRFALRHSGPGGAGTVSLTLAGRAACSDGAFVARVEVTEDIGGPVATFAYDVSFGPTGAVRWPYLNRQAERNAPSVLVFVPDTARGDTLMYIRGSADKYHYYREWLGFIPGRGLVLHHWRYTEIGQTGSYAFRTFRRTD